MGSAEQFVQAFLLFYFPTVATIVIVLWAIIRIRTTGSSVASKWLRIGYFLVLGVFVFPGSFFLFVMFSDSCHGADSRPYYGIHQLLCGHQIVLELPIVSFVIY